MPTPLRVLVGALGPGVLPTAATEPPPDGTVLLDLGPEHPSGTGLVELRLWVEDDVVTEATVVVGALHRGVEKLFEVRDYRQVLVLADRHDWQAPFAAELTVALTCERLLGLEVPPRAVWLRTLLAEHTRLLSHLGFLGWVPHRLGAASPTSAVREALRGQLQRLSGNRVHPMLNRVGGLAADADDAWLDAERALLTDVRKVADRLDAWLAEPALRDATVGTAVLTPAVVAGHGVTGPAARAGGLEADLRLHRPYLAYRELADLLRPTPATAGDAAARLTTLVHELRVSADLVVACADRLRELSGEVAVRLGKVVRLPEGEAYVATEAPLGVSGVFLVSRGDKTPWRLKLRTPSFNHVSALEPLLRGVHVSALETTLASIGYVVGDIDK
ncbi:NADH-quinone oxidoreductase subunit D [Microlunatus spumicola]|uniref:NADH-quinone oxidoreductase subunit D n=1 Tax=Microlunatus spumicola TaxID=81499 RepID=A0ABP6XXC4_9ACTN